MRGKSHTQKGMYYMSWYMWWLDKETCCNYGEIIIVVRTIGKRHTNWVSGDTEEIIVDFVGCRVSQCGYI